LVRSQGPEPVPERLREHWRDQAATPGPAQALRQGLRQAPRQARLQAPRRALQHRGWAWLGFFGGYGLVFARQLVHLFEQPVAVFNALFLFAHFFFRNLRLQRVDLVLDGALLGQLGLFRLLFCQQARVFNGFDFGRLFGFQARHALFLLLDALVFGARDFSHTRGPRLVAHLPLNGHLLGDHLGFAVDLCAEKPSQRVWIPPANVQA
jgi:hypothetical protein